MPVHLHCGDKRRILLMTSWKWNSFLFNINRDTKMWKKNRTFLWSIKYPAQRFPLTIGLERKWLLTGLQRVSHEKLSRPFWFLVWMSSFKVCHNSPTRDVTWEKLIKANALHFQIFISYSYNSAFLVCLWCRSFPHNILYLSINLGKHMVFRLSLPPWNTSGC